MTEKPKPNIRLIVGFASFAALAYLIFGTGGGESHPTRGKAVLRTKKIPYVTIWPTSESCSAGAGAMSGEELVRIKADAGAFSVDAGTSVEVIESSFTMRRVRILSGRWSGETGWVAMEYVHEP